MKLQSLILLVIWVISTEGVQAAALYRDAVLADNPTAYYRLGESSGTTAFDETGAFNGTYGNSPTLGASSLLKSDTNNTAVGFNPASAHYIALPSMSFSGSAFTAEAWVTLNSFGGVADNGLRTIVGYTDGDSGFDLRVRSNGSIDFVLSLAGTITILNSAPSVISANGSSVYHIVGRYDDNAAAGTEMALYLNGSFLAQRTGSGSVKIDASDAINIGRNGNGALTTTRIWDGVIDEVALYDSALSSARIQAHFDAGTAIPEPSTLILSLMATGVLFWMRNVVRKGSEPR